MRCFRLFHVPVPILMGQVAAPLGPDGLCLPRSPVSNSGPRIFFFIQFDSAD